MGILDTLSDLAPAAADLASGITDIGSKISKANALNAIGTRRKQALDFEAAQQESNAGQSIAIGQMVGRDIQRQTQIINSAALARAAASGAGASDPSVMAIIAQTAGEGAYRSALAIYEGEAQARLDMMTAAAKRVQGETDASDSNMAARQVRQSVVPAAIKSGATLISDAQSLYQKYFPQSLISEG